MRLFISKTLLMLSVCLVSITATAQVRYISTIPHRKFNIKDYTESPRFFQRVYVIFSKPIMPATMTYSYEGRNYYGRTESESVVEKLPSRKNYGLGIGTFIPLSRIGDNSKLCLSVDFMMNTYMWADQKEVSNSTFLGSIQTNTVTTRMVAGLGDLAMPLTLDIRTGCDVMLSKEIPTCFALGMGVYPAFRTSMYYDLEGKNQLSLNPVAKMEFGFRAGMCFKIRAMYEMGRMNFIDYHDGGEGLGYEESLVVESKGNFILSLIVTPTAFSWGKDQ